MNISATGCTPIKPQASFGQQKQDPTLDMVISKTDGINDSLVKTGNLKGPIAVVASVALAAAVTYTSGKKAAEVANTLTKGKAGELVMNTIEKGTGAIKKGAEDLASKELKGKGGKALNGVGKAVKAVNEAVSNAVTKFAYRGTADIADVAAKKSKAFTNIVGAGTVAALLPSLCKRDGDKNGVADMAEKNQNVYTGTAYERSKQIAVDNAQKIGLVADLVQNLM